MEGRKLLVLFKLFFFLVNIDWNLQRCIQIMVIIRLLKTETRGTKTQNNFSHKV